MSYDYNALVSAIISHRRQAAAAAAAAAAADHHDDDQQQQPSPHLQQAVDTFATLSTYCPMTPLLWIQYASDASQLLEQLLLGSNNNNNNNNSSATTTSQQQQQQEAALKIRLETLELGIAEFPGCAMLRLHYLELLLLSCHHQHGVAGAMSETQQQHRDDDDDENKIHKAFEEALTDLGRGSHRNEDELIANIYRLYAKYLLLTTTTVQTKTKDDGIDRRRPTEEVEALIMELFIQRAETPMKDANDALMDEFQEFCHLHNLSVMANNNNENNLLQRLEQGRRWASKTYSSLVTWEDEVDMAMHEEGVLSRQHEKVVAVVSSSSSHDAIVDWDSLIIQTSGEQSRFWMGLGGTKTATAFIKYAQACAKYSSSPHHTTENDDDNNNQDDDDDSETDKQKVHALALSVYERGVSECPTVESLWVSYLRHLMHLVVMSSSSSSSTEKQDGGRQETAVVALKLQTVAARAVRNCPYSSTLFQQKMKAIALVAQIGQSVLDPDAIMAVVQEAVDAKFLPDPSHYLELYLSAIRIIKRHIMSLVSKETTEKKTGKTIAYDMAESMEKRVKNNESAVPTTTTTTAYADLDAETEEEVQDLVEDLREMYDTTDAYLRKNHNSWTEGRCTLWRDRAQTETYLLGPLMMDDDDAKNETTKNNNNNSEMIRCYEKLVRLHQPTPPDYFSEYIRSVMGNLCVSTAGEVVARLRKVRGLYQKALTSVKKLPPQTQSGSSSSSAPYDSAAVALHNLCNEYLEFERCFGSEQSYSQALKAVQKKLHTSISNGSRTVQQTYAQPLVVEQAVQQQPTADSATGTKRKLSEESMEQQPSNKKQKSPLVEEEPGQDDAKNDKEKKVNLKVAKQHPVYKVKIGKLEYPAHPFTVRVTNLSLDTEDMDLVDLFKPKCGPIVHAKILREKHQQHGKGKSKGSGLIQFENHDSVTKALELNDVLGFHEKLIKVERSHIPAVGLVPAGMHRVNRKGEGRSSKRNQKHKQQHKKEDKAKDASEGSIEKPSKREDTSTRLTGDILAFRPRGLAHSQAHRKIHVSLGTKKDSEKDAP